MKYIVRRRACIEKSTPKPAVPVDAKLAFTNTDIRRMRREKINSVAEVAAHIISEVCAAKGIYKGRGRGRRAGERGQRAAHTI